MNQIREQLEGVVSSLRSIEEQAGGISGIEKQLCQQTRILAESVKELFARLELIEKKGNPPSPFAGLGAPFVQGR